MRKNSFDCLQLVPYVALYIIFFLIPAGHFFIISFFKADIFSVTPGFFLDNYIRIWSQFFGVILFTYEITVIVSVSTVVIAFIIAYHLRFFAGRYKNLFFAAVLVTLFGGYLTKIYIWKTIFGDSGILSSLFLFLGLPDLAGMFGYGAVSIVITLVYYLVPIAILPIYGSLNNLSVDPLRSARDLGASPIRTLIDITIPCCRTGILFAFAIAFLFTAGDYVVPLIVGGKSSTMLGSIIYSEFGIQFNPPLGAAISFTSMFVSLLFILFVHVALRRLMVRVS